MQTTLTFPGAHSRLRTNPKGQQTNATAASKAEAGDPLENPSYDARGTVPDHGPLIPNPAHYPAPSQLGPRDPMETTWGFGKSENAYNTEIEQAVRDVWKHEAYPLDPVTFKALVAAESAFKKDAVSPTGAVGLVQITGGTAEAYGLRTSPPPDQRRLPEKALPAGVQILADKLSVIDRPNTEVDYGKTVADYYVKTGKPNPEQMETLALAGYNGGGSTVLRAMAYAIEDGLDPREFANLVGEERPTTETPLYKAIKDTFGESFAEGKYHEMGAYPGRIHNIRTREFQPLRGKRIMVDPGHGGGDAGARGPAGTKESMVNLGVSLKLRDKLVDLGAEVRMTRDTDRKVSHPDATQREELVARVKLANEWPAQVFVAVHANSATDPAAHGTETYHSRNASKKSMEMAANVNEEMVKATGFRNRGVKAANFHVIKNTNMPAILVETGFVSNPVEELHLIDPEMQDKMAQAITNGIESSFGLNSNRHESTFADLGRVTPPPVEKPEEFLLS
jgi:N-acetylmuramoyl-L-alanine amidase